MNIEIYFNKITNTQLIYVMPILKRLINDVEPKCLDNEENSLNLFMSNFSLKDTDLQYFIYKIIINKNNDILYLNILYYFECECELYFKKISK